MAFINASQQNIVSSIELGEKRVGGAGNRSIPINMKNKKALVIALPGLYTWGLQTREYEGKPKTTLSLQFPDKKYTTEAHDAALENIKELVSFVKQQAVNNAKDWLNKNTKSPDVVDALFSDVFNYPKDKETGEPDRTRAPTMRVKIPIWDGKIEGVDVFNHEGKLIFPNGNATIESAIREKTTVQVLLQCGGIWFAGSGAFGITWRLKQAIVHEPKGIPRGVCIMNAEFSAAPKPGGAAEAPAPRSLMMEIASEEAGNSLEVMSDDEAETEETGGGAAEEAPVKGKRVKKRT
jgi:hypothetical protein